MTLLSLCFANCSIVALGNNILNISRGIKLPSLHLSTLYSASALSVCYWLDLVLFKFRDIIFTISTCLSLSSSEFCQLSSLVCCILCINLLLCTSGMLDLLVFLHTFLKWFLFCSCSMSFCTPCIDLVGGSFHNNYLFCCFALGGFVLLFLVNCLHYGSGFVFLSFQTLFFL